MQNEASCDLLDALTGESGAVYETAGALRGGREGSPLRRTWQAGADGEGQRTREKALG